MVRWGLRRCGGALCRPLTWCRTVLLCHRPLGLLCRRWALLLMRRPVQLCLAVMLLLLLLLAFLHRSVLPGAMSYYHDDCLLQEDRRERMRFLLRHVINFLNDQNATYWLDFGTFLGVLREGDIIAHDGDMDVSRLVDDLEADRKLVSAFKQRMEPLDITATDFIARYKDVQVDMFRWQTYNTSSSSSSSGRTKLRVYYPFVPAWSLAESVSDFLFPKDIPWEVLFPLRQIKVFGVMASFPRRPLDFMKLRYPLTWSMTVPYKWKCWV